MIMKASLEISTFVLSFLLLFSEHGVHPFSYNSYATTKCLREPDQGPFYGGGIIINPEFKHGVKGWEVFGNGKVEERLSKDGNRFIVALGRTSFSDSFSQKVQVEQGKIYALTAWVQVSEGSDNIAVVFKSNNGDITHGGSVLAQSGCWSLLKGGMFANFSSTVEIIFESKNTSLEIWVDNVSLQPFTKQQWRSHQDESISKVRKSIVRLKVNNADKTPAKGAEVKIKQIKPNFPFGCAMNRKILTLTEYQNWFNSRFKTTTFTNEMKWYSTEKIRGQENYTIADAMVEFSRKNGISIRGHTVFWADKDYQPDWVKTLNPKDLRAASEKRINSVVSRYKGKLISWDVMNENLHFRFFEEKLGQNASSEFYYKTREIDPKVTVFLNEFNTIEYAKDRFSNPSNYHRKVEEIISFRGENVGDFSLGIGVQGRFGSEQPNLAYMRSALDILGSTGLPIWLTELNLRNGPNQGKYLEEILREAYSHPSVQGIVLFTGPKPAGFEVTPLTDDSFKNTPSGDVVDKLIREWRGRAFATKTDHQGLVEMSLFHGDYEATVKHTLTNSSATVSFKVTNDRDHQKIFQVQI